MCASHCHSTTVGASASPLSHTTSRRMPTRMAALRCASHMEPANPRHAAHSSRTACVAASTSVAPPAVPPIAADAGADAMVAGAAGPGLLVLLGAGAAVGSAEGVSGEGRAWKGRRVIEETDERRPGGPAVPRSGRTHGAVGMGERGTTKQQRSGGGRSYGRERISVENMRTDKENSPERTAKNLSRSPCLIALAMVRKEREASEGRWTAGRGESGDREGGIMPPLGHAHSNVGRNGGACTPDHVGLYARQARENLQRRGRREEVIGEQDEGRRSEEA